jgi:tRNA pseudouridine38-40 synthase
MTRYKIIIEYDGSLFCGWQRQENAFSIQEAIENAIFDLSKERVLVYAAGRTDAGVHAFGQVAHFDLEKLYPPERIIGALNFYLRNYDISILDCEIISQDFHSRFSAKSRSYIYKIINRSSKLSLDRNKAWLIKTNLDISAMQKAASYLIGKHDFSSFRAKGCVANSPIRSITEIIVTSDNNQNIQIYVKAPSFLYHMVRNIVGSLVMVGKGDWNPEYILEILAAKERSKAGPTAPACGLYFLEATY